MAASTRTLRILLFNNTVNGTSTGGTFQHDVYNNGPGTTVALRATLTITAPDASRWGASPTASAGGWTLLSVTGSGATRTFTFSADTQLAPSTTAFRIYDVTVTSGGGNLAPGTRSATVTDAPASASYGPASFTSAAFRGRGGAPEPRASLG